MIDSLDNLQGKTQHILKQLQLVAICRQGSTGLSNRAYAGSRCRTSSGANRAGERGENRSRKVPGVELEKEKIKLSYNVFSHLSVGVYSLQTDWTFFKLRIPAAGQEVPSANFRGTCVSLFASANLLRRMFYKICFREYWRRKESHSSKEGK